MCGGYIYHAGCADPPSSNDAIHSVVHSVVIYSLIHFVVYSFIHPSIHPTVSYSLSLALPSSHQPHSHGAAQHSHIIIRLSVLLSLCPLWTGRCLCRGFGFFLSWLLPLLRLASWRGVWGGGGFGPWLSEGAVPVYVTVPVSVSVSVSGRGRGHDPSGLYPRLSPAREWSWG